MSGVLSVPVPTPFVVYTTWAAAFIYDVAAVKKIDGVPRPRFNLVFQVSALFHHEWPRFHHEWPRFNLVLNLPRFWSPPISFWSRFASETNISTNPAWRHILSSSSQINAVAHMFVYRRLALQNNALHVCHCSSIFLLQYAKTLAMDGKTLHLPHWIPSSRLSCVSRSPSLYVISCISSTRITTR